MTAITPQLYDEQLDRMPTSARVLYLILLELYVKTCGEAKVFVEFEGRERDERSTCGFIKVRPSNVHGSMHFHFDEHGDLSDAIWSEER